MPSTVLGSEDMPMSIIPTLVEFKLYSQRLIISKTEMQISREYQVVMRTREKHKGWEGDWEMPGWAGMICNFKLVY